MANRFTEIEAEEKVLKVLPNHIKFLGWVEGKWISTRKSNVKLHCDIHNNDFTLGFSYIKTLKPEGIGCPDCLEMSKRMGKGISKSKNGEQRAKELINKLLPSHIIFLGWTDSWISMRQSSAKFYCTLHDQTFIVKCKYLPDHRTIKCPKCIEGRIVSEIMSAINFKNNYLGTNIDFLGFVGDYNGIFNTKIKLKCNIHNIIWESSISNLLNNKLSLFCPECLLGNAGHSSLSEKLCFDLIKKYCKKDILTQYKFKVYDKICKVNRKIFVDFYIKDLNLVIEYDGKQHYIFSEYYHRNNYNIFVKQINRDCCLVRYCKENSINLLRISYKDNNRLEEVIKAFFVDGKDITTKVDPILLPIKYEGGTVNG